MEDYKIYPKQFQNEKVLIQKNKCFMIMPFDDEFNGIYGVIKEETEKWEIICNRADEMNGSQPIVNKIIKGILESQLIIVDITNARPNVFYELGIAHSFRDAQNILILKQKMTQYPFDISHLPYKEYDPSNLFQLRSIISQFVQNSKYITDFREALAINDIYDYSVNGSGNYIEYIENYFSKEISIYCSILNDNTAGLNDQELDAAFSSFENMIGTAVGLKNSSVIDGLIRVYIKLIEKCNVNRLSIKYASRFSEKLLIWKIEDDARLAKETDLMLALAENNKVLDFCLPWIIGYFSRSKSSSIDLNRYKLEHFLMRTTNKDVDAVVVNSIFHDDCHVREHMADIISAKRIKEGFPALKKQLLVEENWFTIGSIVEAIGHIAPPDEGIRIIEAWINENGTRIIEGKQFFLLKHLAHGIMLLETDGTEHLDNFLSQYRTYLYENQVGPIN